MEILETLSYSAILILESHSQYGDSTVDSYVSSFVICRTTDLLNRFTLHIHLNYPFFHFRFKRYLPNHLSKDMP